ncbi:hypothetical protein PEC301875_03960 [Pectobacterium carotovorum subsp. carotovorum]|nr:hypothetical protein PEC301875_03960 [Pectobacterium carotovorum subsp. carotovorum]
MLKRERYSHECSAHLCIMSNAFSFVMSLLIDWQFAGFHVVNIFTRLLSRLLWNEVNGNGGWFCGQIYCFKYIYLGFYSVFGF